MVTTRDLSTTAMGRHFFGWDWGLEASGNRSKDANSGANETTPISETIQTLEQGVSPTVPSGQLSSPEISGRSTALPSAAQAAGLSAEPSQTPKDFIVFLAESPGGGGVEERANALMRSLGLNMQPTMVFDQLGGFVVTITERQAQRLRALGGVSSVEEDAAVFLEPPIVSDPWSVASSLDPITGTALKVYPNSAASTGETLPWSVKAVWQGYDISTKGNVASDTYAFVIDSGILKTTNDLSFASDLWQRSWVTGETPFTDGNGHGTHVAGTIGALANNIGVVGVAPGAQMISLKVFNSTGGGASYSSIIDAINHAVTIINGYSLNLSKVVVNMSLGGGYSSSLDSAIKSAANQGIRFALAAGNDGRDADGYSPAAAGDHSNIYTISAVDSSYRMTSWSNWDRRDTRDTIDDVDFAAPGASILSYYKGGQLTYLNGTSMAAPHVAGLLLLGGVTSGGFVTPYYRNTADVFAWGNWT